MAFSRTYGKLRNDYNTEIVNYKNYKKDIYEKVEQGLRDVENGSYRPAQNFFHEMEEKYNINE